MPSNVDQRPRSTWLTATVAPDSPASLTLCAFTLDREQITLASSSFSSTITPTGTTCGNPLARKLVRVLKCHSFQKLLSSSLTSTLRIPPVFGASFVFSLPCSLKLSLVGVPAVNPNPNDQLVAARCDHYFMSRQ